MLFRSDQVKRWVAEHAVFLQRFSEDCKYEKRWPKPVRQAMNEYRRKRVQKHRERLDDWNQKACAALVNYAERQGVNTIVLDTSIRDYLPSFPWADFATKLRHCAEGKGIEVRGSVEDETENEGV